MLTSTTSSLWKQLKTSLQAPSSQPPVSLLCPHLTDAGLAVHLSCPQLRHHACWLGSAAQPWMASSLPHVSRRRSEAPMHMSS